MATGIEGKPIFVHDLRLKLLRLHLVYLPFYGIFIGEMVLASFRNDWILLDIWIVAFAASFAGLSMLIWYYRRKARHYEFYDEYLRAYYNPRKHKDIPYSETRRVWEQDRKGRQMCVIRADSGNSETEFVCHLYDRKIDSSMTLFDWLKMKFGQ